MTISQLKTSFLSYLRQSIEKLLRKRNRGALNSTHTVRHRSHDFPHIQFFVIKLNPVRSFSGIFLPSEDVDTISDTGYAC